jgi:nucleotide-binding universal stress UspA family protein
MMSFRILVALDGSTYAMAGLKMAIALHKQVGGTLTGLHVVPTVTASGNFIKDLPGRLGFEPAVVEAEVNQHLDDVGRKMLTVAENVATLAGVSIKTLEEHGTISTIIEHHAAHADVLVMGLRGITEQRHPGQGGSHLREVLDITNTPTILAAANSAELSKIAIGYDGSDSAAHGLRFLRHILEAGGKLDIHAICVGEDDAVLQEVADELAEFSPALSNHVVQGDDIAETLAMTATNLDADALLVGFCGKSPLKDFLNGTATDDLVSNNNIALIIVH